MPVEYGLKQDRARLIDAIEETIDTYCAYGIEDEKTARLILDAIDGIDSSYIIEGAAWDIRNAWDCICWILWSKSIRMEGSPVLSAEPKAYRHTLFSGNFAVEQQWYNHA